VAVDFLSGQRTLAVQANPEVDDDAARSDNDLSHLDRPR